MQQLQNVSVQFVKGIGPARKKVFARLGVENIEDLLYLFPRRYEDRRQMTPIKSLKIGEYQTTFGKVLALGSRRSWYTRKHVLQVPIEDGTSRLFCLWFNQPYMEHYFRVGKRVVVYGKVGIYKNRLQMISPEWEILEGDKEDECLSLGRIVPIYPLTRGITQRYLRKTIRGCLTRYKEEFNDDLPVYLRNQYKLYNIKRSLENIHFPQDIKDQQEALKRISFEEFFFFQISIMQRRLSLRQKEGVTHSIRDHLALKYAHGFPFDLTSAQKRVIQEIRLDMEKAIPMLRLLQGDVGSGKTVVALFGCWTAKQNGFQSVIMAPTEILARQHFETLEKFSVHGPLKDVRAALLLSSLPAREKEKIKKDIEQGKIDIAIGTHALIQEEVKFKNLSFAVIDEQHKFGVRQRALLSEKGKNPDILIMTATPIPRTLCMTLYGDLDVSILDEMPSGRPEVKTLLYYDDQLKEVYELIRQRVEASEQTYIVYPIIEESENLDLKAAEVMYEYFRTQEFKDFKVGLIHGRMKRQETQAVMKKFRNKELDILVATTIVEVGLDIPDATLMVVEHAQRFGLAQLHQLRGRIGRGTKESLFILICDRQAEDDDPARQSRLKAILSTNDGFQIAEEDLLIRGPGQFFGRHQHGLNELKIANPITQLEILESARKEAQALMEADPNLEKGKNPFIKQTIRRRYPGYLAMVSAG